MKPNILAVYIGIALIALLFGWFLWQGTKTQGIPEATQEETLPQVERGKLTQEGESRPPGVVPTEEEKSQKFQKLKEEGKLSIVQVLKDEDLGDYLSDKDGMTLYTFEQDSKNELKSSCLDECVKNWPPFLATPDEKETLKFSDDALSKNLNLFEREDGSVQCAYGNSPIYYYAQDTKSGDTKGQGLGDVWFVARPKPGSF